MSDRTIRLDHIDLEELEQHAVRPDMAWEAGLRRSPVKADEFVLLWPDAEGDLQQARRVHGYAREEGKPKIKFAKNRTPGLHLARGTHAQPAIVVEGYMQHLAVASWAVEGYAVYGMAGCDGINAKNATSLPPFRDRDVWLIFDADWRSNPNVRAAAGRVARHLRDRGAATIRVVNVPGAGTDGIDDVLARVRVDGRSYFLSELLSLATELDAEDGDSGRLPVHRVADLRAQGWKPEWLIKRLWPYPGHGMLGGMEKTFKTWLLCFLAVAVASGRHAFGDERFEVVTRGPVVLFTGEAGRFALERRLRRVARELYGMSDEDYDELPLYVIDQRALLTSDTFMATLRELIADLVPVLVGIDPLYTYVGANTEAGNVFAVGESLHAVSDACNEANVALLIGHHLRKTAAGQVPSLTDLTQAGGREWVKSWLLVSHREQPNLDSGCASLLAQAGGSDGYGFVFDLDVCVGAFNADTFDHTGEVSVVVSDSEVVDANEQRAMARNMQDQLDLRALLVAVDEAGEHSDDTSTRALMRTLGWKSDRRLTVVTEMAVEAELLTVGSGRQNRVVRAITDRGRGWLESQLS